MNNLILPSSSGATMTSVDLRDVINTARIEFGETRVRNDQLVSRIEDELCGELGVCKIIAHPQSGVEMRYYDLTIDQCMLVGMRESKYVRRKVLELLNKPTTPQTFAEALQLAADQAKQLELAAPKVSAYDKLIESTHLKSVGDVAKSIGLRSAQALNKKLEAVRAYDGRCGNRVWSGWFVEQGLGEMRTTDDGYSSNKMTAKGQAWALNLFGID